jgi:hypothetical protein
MNAPREIDMQVTGVGLCPHIAQAAMSSTEDRQLLSPTGPVGTSALTQLNITTRTCHCRSCMTNRCITATAADTPQSLRPAYACVARLAQQNSKPKTMHNHAAIAFEH